MAKYLRSLANRLNVIAMQKKRGPLRVKVEIEGVYADVLADIGRMRVQKAVSLVKITIEAKAAEGSWTEDYELPVLNGTDTHIPNQRLEGLYKQGRITKEQYDEAQKAILNLNKVGHESSHYWDRYGRQGSLVS